MLCLPCFPLPAPRFLRCVWRAVPSGCPFSWLAGTPFHAVCASAGSDRLPFWFSPRVLCVCVRSRFRGVRAPPAPPRVGVALAPRAVPVLGAGRAVPIGPCPSACPASAPCSVWLAWGGGGLVPLPPYLAWGCALPVGWVRAWGPVTNPTARTLASWPCALAWRAVERYEFQYPGGSPERGACWPSSQMMARSAASNWGMQRDWITQFIGAGRRRACPTRAPRQPTMYPTPLWGTARVPGYNAGLFVQSGYKWTARTTVLHTDGECKYQPFQGETPGDGDLRQRQPPPPPNTTTPTTKTLVDPEQAPGEHHKGQQG